SVSFSHAVCGVMGLNRKQKIGELSDQQLKEIETMIKNPTTLPQYLFNRRKDPESGKDIHVIGTDLRLQNEFDVRLMKKIKSYKGMRHAYGLPVRGQRTRGNFRKGAAVGVVKKATKIAQAKAGAAPEKDKKK
ncbi:MAG: 30S ribosomal protein S13, partial [Nanoarchaeota archaeon]